MFESIDEQPIRKVKRAAPIRRIDIPDSLHVRVELRDKKRPSILIGDGEMGGVELRFSSEEKRSQFAAGLALMVAEPVPSLLDRLRAIWGLFR